MGIEANTEYIQPVTSEPQLTIANKCFIYCPAEYKTKPIIFRFKLQAEGKLPII